MKKKIMIAFGTRPEAIKLVPVIKELLVNSHLFELQIVVSGQHQEMLYQILDQYNIVPHLDLKVMKTGQTLNELTTQILTGMQQVLLTYQPDLVLVHGDTTTALATAQACFYEQIKVGHIEAGLRTYHSYNPFPEEMNRQLISKLAHYHFAPTSHNMSNLAYEGILDNVFVTGNTAIDTLLLNTQLTYTDTYLTQRKNKPFILLTTHRRENLGSAMADIFAAVSQLAKDFPDFDFVYPMHLNPQIRQLALETLSQQTNIYLIEPLDVLAFHHYIQQSFMVLTDSGGIQEEAPAVDKPVLVLRETSERSEGVTAGTLALVGTSKKGIYDAVQRLITDTTHYQQMAQAENPYGDGTASKKIIRVLASEL